MAVIWLRFKLEACSPEQVDKDGETFEAEEPVVKKAELEHEMTDDEENISKLNKF